MRYSSCSHSESKQPQYSTAQPLTKSDVFSDLIFFFLMCSAFKLEQVVPNMEECIEIDLRLVVIICAVGMMDDLARNKFRRPGGL